MIVVGGYMLKIGKFLPELCEIDRAIKEGMLCRVEIVAVYPSIPHVEGLEAKIAALD